MSDPADIARTLTKAQRSMILRENAMRPHDVRRLREKGLCGGWAQFYQGGPYTFSLTPLGLAVRQHLESEQ